MKFRGTRHILAALTILSANAFIPARATPETIALEMLARQIVEYKCNVPRWTWLAHRDDDNTALCPTAPLDEPSPQSLKDQNEMYFRDRAQRANEAQQSWRGLESSARGSVSSLLDPLLNAAPEPGTGLDTRLVANAYQGGASHALHGLGLGTEAGASNLINAILSGSFAPSSAMFGPAALAPLTSVDITSLQTAVQAARAAYTNLGSNENLTRMAAKTKLETDNQKTRLHDSALVAQASRLRRDGMRELTQKLLASGATDQGKIAEYEFYLAALDALAREAAILTRAHHVGSRAEAAIKSTASNAAYLKSKLGF